MAEDSLDRPMTVEYLGSRPYDYEEILHAKPRPTRRLFAGYNPLLLQEMNDAIANNWDCGICSETATDPCVTRCGHLFCQSELLQWLDSNPTCPKCKMPCTPSADATPVFARDWVSPFMPPQPHSPSPLRQGHLSPSASGQSSSLSSRQSESDYSTTVTYEKSSGSPTPTQLPDQHSHSLFLDPNYSYSSSSIVRPDGTESKRLKKSPSTFSLPPSDTTSLHHHPHLHPLTVYEITAYYGSIMLRILGLLILLFALLR